MHDGGDFPLTPYHCAIQGALRVAEVRAEGATPIPEGYVPLGVDAFAARVGLKRRAAHYRLERLEAIQGRGDALRVVLLPVKIGSGAERLARHVLWPVAPTSAAA